MKILQINLDDGLPNRVTVELTIDELVWIGKVTGKHSPKSSEETVPGYGHVFDGIYEAVTGGVFNRFWDNGIDGCINGDTE